MSVCAQKARMTLAEQQLEWKVITSTCAPANISRSRIFNINPNAVVPTLLDNGAVIIQLTVVCE